MLPAAHVITCCNHPRCRRPRNQRQSRLRAHGTIPSHHTHQFKCRKYGQLKNEEPEWVGKGCVTKCAICGAVPLWYEPRFRGGLSIDVSHQWTGKTCQDICKLCGTKYPGGHRWSGNTCKDHCEICGERYSDGHVFEEVSSRQPSYGTRVAVYRCKYCGKEYDEPYDFRRSDSV